MSYNWETDYSKVDVDWLTEFYLAIQKEYDNIYGSPNTREVFTDRWDKIVTDNTIYTVFYNVGGKINVITVQNNISKRFCVYDAT